MRRSRIAVVGFGVAGATAATLLAEQGHEVTVFEQASALEPVGAGVLLQPSGQGVLERLGALDAIARRSEQIYRIVARSNRGRVIVDLAYSDGGDDLHGLGVARSTLHEALCALADRAGIDLRVSTRVVSHKGGWVTDAAGVRHGPFGLVVGADGAASAIRARSGLVRWSHEYAHGALWTVGRTSQVRGELRQVVRGTRDCSGCCRSATEAATSSSVSGMIALPRSSIAGFQLGEIASSTFALSRERCSRTSTASTGLLSPSSCVSHTTASSFSSVMPAMR